MQGVYFGCTNGAIVCVDPESSAVLGTTAALETGSEAAAVSSVAVNREAVVACSSESPQLTFYSRCTASSLSGKQQQQTGKGMQLLGSVRASSKGELQKRNVWHAGNLVCNMLGEPNQQAVPRMLQTLAQLTAGCDAVPLGLPVMICNCWCRP